MPQPPRKRPQITLTLSAETLGRLDSIVGREPERFRSRGQAIDVAVAELHARLAEARPEKPDR